MLLRQLLPVLLHQLVLLVLVLLLLLRVVLLLVLVLVLMLVLVLRQLVLHQLLRRRRRVVQLLLLLRVVQLLLLLLQHRRWWWLRCRALAPHSIGDRWGAGSQVPLRDAEDGAALGRGRGRAVGGILLAPGCGRGLLCRVDHGLGCRIDNQVCPWARAAQHSSFRMRSLTGPKLPLPRCHPPSSATHLSWNK